MVTDKSVNPSFAVNPVVMIPPMAMGDIPPAWPPFPAITASSNGLMFNSLASSITVGASNAAVTVGPGPAAPITRPMKNSSQGNKTTLPFIPLMTYLVTFSRVPFICAIANRNVVPASIINRLVGYPFRISATLIPPR